MAEKKRLVVQCPLPRGKDALVQSEYRQEYMVRFRSGTRRRHLHPCRRADPQHGFSCAGAVYLGHGGGCVRSGRLAVARPGKGVRACIPAGRGKGFGLRRTERLSFRAGHTARCGRPALSASQLPRAWETVFRYRLSERGRRMGVAKQAVQGVHTAERHLPCVAAAKPDGSLRRVRGLLRLPLRRDARPLQKKRCGGA